MSPAVLPLLPDVTHARRMELAAGGVLGYDEAAAFLGIRRRQVERLVDRGELVAARQGRRVVVLRVSVTEYLAARIVIHPTTEVPA